jgi:hypothetical protein
MESAETLETLEAIKTAARAELVHAICKYLRHKNPGTRYLIKSAVVGVKLCGLDIFDREALANFATTGMCANSYQKSAIRRMMR